MRVLGLALSPGRSGTTSLTALLRDLAPQGVHAWHEHLVPNDTLPGRFFRAWDGPRLDALEAHPPVRRFLSELEALDEDESWIDPGWSLYPLVPLLLRRYPGRVRLLHVLRHPVLAAASGAVHGGYAEAEEAELGIAPEAGHFPWSPGAFHPELSARWTRLTPFERHLFRVTEIHRFALEVHTRHPEVPFLQVRVEALSDPAVTRRILALYGLNAPAGVRVPRVNENRRLARGARAVGSEWRRAAEHPWAVSLAARLGYDLRPEALEALAPKMERYRRHGPVEHLAGLVFRFGPARRLWRRGVLPLLFRRAGANAARWDPKRLQAG